MPTKIGKKRNRARPVVRAKQSEVTSVGKLIRQIGSMGGGALGAYAGMPMAGSAAGNSLGAAISKWLGFGDYTVGTNSIVQKASTGIPMMHKDGQSVTIRHREFIATVESSTSFNVARSFQLNPGNSETFPWLSTVANSFQEYKFKGIVFHYIPTSGNAISGTSPSLGSVMMQTSYRANDTAPISKSELLNEYWSGEAVPSETFAHPIECNPAENPFNVQYVRRGDIPSGDNQLFYDLGVTHVCTQGQLADGNNLGDVWVTYEVELKKPIVASNVTAMTTSYAGKAETPLATIASLFGGLQRQYGSMSIRGVGNSLVWDYPSSGTYILSISLTGTGFGGLYGTLTLTNATLAEYVPGKTKLETTPVSTSSVYETAFRVTDPNKPVTVAFSNSLVGTLTSTAISVARLLD